MDLLIKFQKKVERAADLIKFEITYLPGLTEDLDQYKASNDFFSINCYGSTEKDAINSAKREASSILFGQISLADSILAEDLRIRSLVNKKIKKLK